MSSDPRDYKLDLSSAAANGGQANSAGSLEGRPYLSVQFDCCGVYQRIYRSADGKAYRGRCPRCAAPVQFPVGTGGTAARFFRVS